jgi:hypothetical protein
MNIKHRFWQVLALTLATLAMERRWVAAVVAVAGMSWLGGLIYVLLGV